MAAVIIVLVISGVVALRNFRELQQTRLRVSHSNHVLAGLRLVEAAVMDAESGQRGFLITGDEAYLEPFDDAVRRVRASLNSFASLIQDNATQRAAVPELRGLVEERLAELQHVLEVREHEGLAAAQQTVASATGKRTMDRIHAKAQSIREVEYQLLMTRENAAALSYHSGISTSILSTLTGLLLVGGVLYLLEHNRRKAERSALDLRTTRERLQLALDAAEMGSWNINPDTRQLIADEQFCKIFGIPLGEASYQRAVDALHPEDRSRVEAAIAASTRADNPTPYSIEYRVVHADGSVHWVLAKGAAHFTQEREHRTIASFDGTITDITDRKRQERRLLESERSALAASRSKSEFLANMSHEIRTPMAAILGYADVLLGHLADPDNRNCVLVIKRNGKHLLELINDILDLSRIEAGKLDVELETVSLPQLVAEVQSLMHVRATEKRLDFRTEFNGQVPETIQTDPTRLRQMLINLIGNAIKFTEKGTVTLTVNYEEEPSLECHSLLPSSSSQLPSSTLGSSQSSTLSFAIRDTGIGISPEQQQRLFKPFSQGDSSITRSYGGSGLGLAISLRLAEMLGGAIAVESALGVGSTFTVTLPIDSSKSGQLIPPSVFAVEQVHDHQRVEDPTLTCRVLVVDDRRDVRHISQHFLEKAGAEVLTAEDGRQAINLAIEARDSGEPFDLIVMDMQMPNVDGLQATAELRSAGIQWPVIALTADAMKGDRDRFLDGGCDDYLSKPIDHRKLVNMVAFYTQDIEQEELQAKRLERAAALRASLGEKH
ncbi:Autoinducer 2 sensor kinase/phosphatase LuxQ [Aureliella helgolandensis]|uniref:histidine kinase n=2 Tax=Aureliella helgolandensis TaxID=2527968 RepID=A0A518GFS4_9BACT|nr:Autoinducer 2 sensor kinase/phosphatase LuxQ [Aureliella helgolandensis]